MQLIALTVNIVSSTETAVLEPSVILHDTRQDAPGGSYTIMWKLKSQLRRMPEIMW